MIWQRIKRCTGTRQRPSQHPDPIQESNRLLSDFVARSSSEQLPEDDVILLQQQQPIRRRQLYDAINSHDECDRPIAISELNKVLKKVRDSSPGDDTICTRTPCRTGGFRHAGKLQLLFLFPVREKIILQRIRWSAEPPNTRATSFKPGSITRDAVSNLIHDISSFRTRRRRGAVVYLDLHKAFELVNKDVILAELVTAGLHGRLLAWISDFLTTEATKSVFKTAQATLRVLRMALPQGGSNP